LAPVLRKEIMMSSNYPPGVTGREFEIAGPDSEFESDHFCPVCYTSQPGFVMTYGGISWFNCSVCGEDMEIDYESSFPNWKESQYD